MTASATSWVDRNMGLIALVCVVGTCVCFAGIGYLQLQVRGQASEGQTARSRQERTFPTSLKVYEDAYRRGVITARELACFRDSRRCPYRATGTP
jgi:hypothetical protein